jgi:hypothetical protein
MHFKRFELDMPFGWRPFRLMTLGWYHCESCHGAVNTYEAQTDGDELALLAAHAMMTCRRAPALTVVAA